MPFTDKQIVELSAPLNGNVVKTNPKGHDYIEGWHAIAEANRIFGFDGWARELLSLAIVGEPYQTNGNWRVGYRATVRITANGIARDGTGYGSGITKDLNDAHEGAVKEAETDAMKRALMTFGNPFGLALYDKERANVEQPIAETTQQMLGGIAAASTIAGLYEWKALNGAAVNASADKRMIAAAFSERETLLTAKAA